MRQSAIAAFHGATRPGVWRQLVAAGGQTIVKRPGSTEYHTEYGVLSLPQQDLSGAAS